MASILASAVVLACLVVALAYWAELLCECFGGTL
jgi:hypothetical protein